MSLNQNSWESILNCQQTAETRTRPSFSVLFILFLLLFWCSLLSVPRLQISLRGTNRGLSYFLSCLRSVKWSFHVCLETPDTVSAQCLLCWIVHLSFRLCFLCRSRFFLNTRHIFSHFTCYRWRQTTQNIIREQQIVKLYTTRCLISVSLLIWKKENIFIWGLNAVFLEAGASAAWQTPSQTVWYHI